MYKSRTERLLSQQPCSLYPHISNSLDSSVLLFFLHASLSKPEKATSSTSFYYYFNCLSFSLVPAPFPSACHIFHAHLSGVGDSEGTVQKPLYSCAVLLPLAVISLSHWSMIHVCENLSLLARCTAARCRHCCCCCWRSCYNDWTHSESLSNMWWLCAFLLERRRERWTLRERWIDRQGEKRVRVRVHAEHMLLA